MWQVERPLTWKHEWKSEWRTGVGRTWELDANIFAPSPDSMRHTQHEEKSCMNDYGKKWEKEKEEKLQGKEQQIQGRERIYSTKCRVLTPRHCNTKVNCEWLQQTIFTRMHQRVGFCFELEVFCLDYRMFSFAWQTFHRPLHLRSYSIFLSVYFLGWLDCISFTHSTISSTTVVTSWHFHQS